MMWRTRIKPTNIPLYQHSLKPTPVWNPKVMLRDCTTSPSISHVHSDLHPSLPLPPSLVPSTSSFPRVFASCDYKRRLLYLDRLMSLGLFSTKVFETYNVTVLFKLLYTLENFSYEDLGLKKHHYKELKLLLVRFLQLRSSFQSKQLYLNKDLLITIFTSPSLDKVGLNSILKSPEVMGSLPHFVRRFWKHPLVVWKYVKTLGQKAFNYGEIGRRLSEQTKLTILIKESQSLHFK